MHEAGYPSYHSEPKEALLHTEVSVSRCQPRISQLVLPLSKVQEVRIGYGISAASA
jgi:hypothetical protein